MMAYSSSKFENTLKWMCTNDAETLVFELFSPQINQDRNEFCIPICTSLILIFSTWKLRNWNVLHALHVLVVRHVQARALQ